MKTYEYPAPHGVIRDHLLTLIWEKCSETIWFTVDKLEIQENTITLQIRENIDPTPIINQILKDYTPPDTWPPPTPLEAPTEIPIQSPNKNIWTLKITDTGNLQITDIDEKSPPIIDRLRNLFK